MKVNKPTTKIDLKVRPEIDQFKNNNFEWSARMWVADLSPELKFEIGYEPEYDGDDTYILSGTVNDSYVHSDGEVYAEEDAVITTDGAHFDIQLSDWYNKDYIDTQVEESFNWHAHYAMIAALPEYNFVRSDK